MRVTILRTVLLSLTAGHIAHGQISEQCVTDNVCYQLNIPASTARTGTGDVFFSISGPTSHSWLALGQGSNGMSNANTFIVYADGTGNVTLSARHSRSDTAPVYDSAVDVELLSGSGIRNGIMKANVRCGNCQTWGVSGTMSFNSSSGGWIHARRSGSAMNTTNVQQAIRKHDAYGEFTWTHASATGGVSTNPFQDSTLTSIRVTQGTSKINSTTVLWCHGLFASVAFVLLFPMGAILIRLGSFPGLLWVHTGLQSFSFILLTTALGLGLYYGILGGYMTETHPIFGIVLVALLLFQLLFGWLHHKRFVQTGTRSASSYSHIWVGRIAIVLGMVNGGLGMNLSRASSAYMIVYSVIAAIMGTIYLGTIVYGNIVRRKTSTHGNGHEMFGKVHSTPEERLVKA